MVERREKDREQRQAAALERKRKEAAAVIQGAERGRLARKKVKLVKAERVPGPEDRRSPEAALDAAEVQGHPSAVATQTLLSVRWDGSWASVSESGSEVKAILSDGRWAVFDGSESRLEGDVLRPERERLVEEELENETSVPLLKTKARDALCDVYLAHDQEADELDHDNEDKHLEMQENRRERDVDDSTEVFSKAFATLTAAATDGRLAEALNEGGEEESAQEDE